MMSAPDHIARWRGIDVARWGLCAVMILAVHAGAAAYIIMRGPSAPLPGASPAIAMELEPEAPSLPNATTELPPGPEMEKNDQPDKVVEKPDDEDATTETEKPPVEVEPEAPPAPLAPPPQVTAAPPRPPEPPAETKPVEKRPELPKRPVPKKKPVKKQNPITAAPQQAPASERTRTTQGETNAQMAAQAKASWGNQVVAILRRNTRYPASAERRGIRGTARVRITVGRGGNLISASLSGSAGDGELDQEAVALARRVSYPALPPEIPGGSHSVIVPINFNAR